MRLLALLLAMAALSAADPTLTLGKTAFDYDLRMLRPYLPLAWEGAGVAFSGTARVRIVAAFDGAPFAADASDVLTVRSGVGVAVKDGGHLKVDGEDWLWAGPQSGAAANLVLESANPVSAANALLVVQQLFYANLGGSRKLTPDRRIRLGLHRLDHDGAIVASSVEATIAIHPIQSDIPLQVRLRPLTIIRGDKGTIQVADIAGTLPTAAAPVTFHVPAMPETLGLALTTPLELVDPWSFTGLLSTGVDTPMRTFDLRFGVSSKIGTTLVRTDATLPVTVLPNSTAVRFVGDLPLAIDLRDPIPVGPLADVACVFTTTVGQPIAASLVRHPGYPRYSDLATDITQTELDGVVTVANAGLANAITVVISRARLRVNLLATGKRPPFIHVELRLEKDGSVFHVPAVIRLTWSDPG